MTKWRCYVFGALMDIEVDMVRDLMGAMMEGIVDVNVVLVGIKGQIVFLVWCIRIFPNEFAIK